MRKRLRVKWDKFRARTPTPEPGVGGPASAPLTPPVTAPILSPSVTGQTPEPTSSTYSGTPRGTPQSPTGSPPTSAGRLVTETSPLSIAVPPSQTPPWPQETTAADLPSSRNATPDTQEGGLEGCPQPTKEGHSNVRDTVTGAVRLALDITESLSDGVPFLPGVVKALRTVVEACEVRRLRSISCLRPFVQLWNLCSHRADVTEIRFQSGVHGHTEETH